MMMITKTKTRKKLKEKEKNNSSLTALHWLLGHKMPEVSNEQEVYEYLMDGYRLSVRPVRNDSDTVDLKLDLYLNILEDLVQRLVITVGLSSLLLLVISSIM